MATSQREFWSKVAPSYDRVVDLQLGGRVRSLVLERLEKEEKLGSVAEFGCGSGFFTAALARRTDHVVATDLAPGMVELARERVRAPNVAFQVEDAQETSFPDGAFDTVFMSLVLHFTEPAVTLAEMRRILKPAGALIVVNLDPAALHGSARIRSALRIFFRGVTGYRTRPPPRFAANMLSERALCARLDECGFNVLGCELIRDTALDSSVPVDYVRARRR